MPAAARLSWGILGAVFESAASIIAAAANQLRFAPRANLSVAVRVMIPAGLRSAVAASVPPIGTPSQPGKRRAV
jgi:hypothetical protein